jgi:hypothetical protein
VFLRKRNEFDDKWQFDEIATSSTTDPDLHYASQWPIDSSEAVKPLEELTELGRRYAESKNSDILLEICRCFHPYLMKYLVMICRGHVPTIGVGKHPLYINKDVKPFIRYFLPKGEDPNKVNLARVVRHFHLAFKGMEVEEIYDVLMALLIAAINGYDPFYKEKIKKVAEVIDHELSKQEQFSAAVVNRYLEFDCARHLRMLARSGFLQKAQGRASPTTNPLICARQCHGSLSNQSSPRPIVCMPGWL